MSVELGQRLVGLVALLGLQTGLSVNEGEDGGDDWTALVRSSCSNLSPYNFILDEQIKKF